MPIHAKTFKTYSRSHVAKGFYHGLLEIYSGVWEQTIQSTNPPVNAATVVLTSRDYGGLGWVSATATVNGQIITANVAATSATEASLPIDLNGDFIPDAYQPSAINPHADAEPNVYGAPAGDGFSAYEEYRGFVENLANSCAPGCIFHTRTNSATAQDAFIVDPHSFYQDYGTILRTKTPFVFHTLSLDLANPNNASDARDGVGLLRRGYVDHVSSIYAFVLVEDNTIGTGVLGQAGSLKNDGIAVKISTNNISAGATTEPIGYDTLFQQTVVHEVGHKLKLQHYHEARPVEPTLAGGTTAAALATNPSLLPLSRYAPCYVPICGPATPPTTGQDGINQKFYVWHQVEHLSSGGIRRQGQIALLVGVNGQIVSVGDLASISPYVGSNQADGFLNSSGTSLIYQYTVLWPQTLPSPATYIEVNLQRFKIMDFTARKTVDDSGNSTSALSYWQFAPDDLSSMVLCGESACPQ
jgi:hypothetical protein